MINTQPNQVLQYLKIHKCATSDELRNAFNFVDIPKSISLLKKRGVEVTSERKHGKTTYYYEGKPTRQIIWRDGRPFIVDE